MAAEGVILENIKRTLCSKKNEWPFSSMQKLEALAESLGKVESAVAMLAGDKDNLFRSSTGNLVALLHQADDLLDEILTRGNGTRFSGVAHQHGNLEEYLRSGLKRMINASSRVGHEVSRFFPSSKQFVFPLLMDKRVEKIAHDIDRLGRQLLNESGSIDFLNKPFDPPQSLTLSENKVIGRDDDKRIIIDMLMLPLRQDEINVSVIPVVGPPGLGKSTLAQLVYDDEKVKKHFDLRMWIQVSQMSDEREIIREIVESCTNRRHNHRRIRKPAKSYLCQKGLAFSDLLGCQRSDTIGTNPTNTADNENDMYARRLRKEIEGKVYLLVLDDACITHGQQLKDLLAAGARGSRVLMTARSSEVADFAKPEIVEPHILKRLEQHDYRSLFDTFAFGQQKKRNRDLQEIGRAIADNCLGVPLTVKVAASFLYGKDKEKWLSFNKELLFGAEKEHVMNHVLHLSYQDLPTRLKACFAYCSLFPDDYSFNKHDLISLWKAQGLISTEHGQSLEEAAEDYFLELSRRCFFEDVITDDLGNIVTCKMHHIIHTLACQYAAGVVNMNMTDSGVNPDSMCKHLLFTCDKDSLKKISTSLLQAQELRSLISVNNPNTSTKIDSLECNRLISSFQRLRVLDMHDLGIGDLSDSVGKLIHLRYLDLSQNDGLVTLPKSVTEMYNLQTLKLNSCTKLRKLPGNFADLVNLERFEVDECDSLTCMPLGLEKLTQLRTLTRFVVSQDCPEDMSNIGLKALKELKNLRGRLAIELTGDWTANIPEAPQAELRNKINLEELKICWAKTIQNVEKSSHLLSEEQKFSYTELLDNLQPTSNLKILCIEGYKGEDFPVWAGVNQLATSLPCLVVISIEGCDKCEHLPPFGKLRYLKKLTLRHMAKVQYVERESSRKSTAGEGEEVTPASPSLYQSLEELVREKTLQESSTGGGPEAAPASPLFFESLEELTLHNFYELKGWWKDEVMVTPEGATPSFRRLSKLKIWNCPNLRSMPLFTEVLDLDLRNVNQMLLENFAQKPSIGANSCIECLKIRGCPNLKSFKTVREGLGSLPRLQELMIEKCHALNSLSSELSYLTSLESLEISSCKQLDLSEEGSDIIRNGNVISTPWTSLGRLRHLTLRELPKMKCLPEGLKHVQNLRSLWISACTALTELPQWIGALTMLQHLRIESCEAVTRLPDGLQEVKSLMKVEITECPELMERCREHTGKDWEKIRHARILLHKSWRYGLMSELGTSKNHSNVRSLTDVKYIIIPVITASI